MIDLQKVTFRYESMQMNFTIHVLGNSTTAIIGPSGGGKSTLLALIAGFEQPLSGSISINAQNMLPLSPAQRPINMIFQDHNVFAHLDIWTNVALGISPSLRLTRAQHLDIDQALARTGIAHLGKRKPGDVSGGERQRVAIARAIVRDKPVLLIDEPFAALGPALRLEMLDLVRDVQAERKLTVMMVTHQPEDALRIAHNTAFLENGQIVAMRQTRELFQSKDLPGLQAYLGTKNKWEAPHPEGLPY